MPDDNQVDIDEWEAAMEFLRARYDDWVARGKPIPPIQPADGWGPVPEDPADARFAERFVEPE